MTPLPLDIFVKASVLLATGALVTAVLRRRGSAAARHLAWAIVIAALVVLPIASAALPHWQIRIPVARAVLTAATPAGRGSSGSDSAVVAGAAAADPASAAISAREARADSQTAALTATAGLLSAVYAAGVLLWLVRLGREPVVLRRLIHTSRSVSDPSWRHLLQDTARQSRVARPIRLLWSAGELMPMTFGTRRPTIVIPASAEGWTAGRRRAVLLHELAHVARYDCLVQRCTAVACAIYWPHPGIWWAARQLRIERELACDDRVLEAGAAAGEYAGHLLDIARSLRAGPAAATAMARPRGLETRLVAVLDEARNRAGLRRGRLAVAIAVSIAVLLPMAALRAAVVPVDGDAVASGAPSVPDVSTPSWQAGSSSTQEFTGSWEIRPSRDAANVDVTMRTGHSSHGTTMSIAKLEALTGMRIADANGVIHFPIRREAGTFTVEGVCRNRICGGTFSFEPSGTFAAALAKRGIGAPTAQDQYKLAIQDVGVAWLDELSTDGYQQPDVRAMVRAAEHGVGLDYVHAMAGLGYRLGTVDALITVRDHGVDPEFVRGLTANGFTHLSADELVRLRDHGVDPAYIRGMRDLGYTGADLPHLVTARDHGVDPEFAKGLTGLGFNRLSLDDLIAARDHGIDPEYIRGMQSSGYRLTLDGLRQTRDHGVDPEYVRGLGALGYKTLSIEMLLRARDHGVDPQYARDLAALGYKDLPLETLIRMRDHGVDAEFVRRLQRGRADRPSVDELIQRRDRGDSDPNAAARATLAYIHSIVASKAARLVAWLRG